MTTTNAPCSAPEKADINSQRPLLLEARGNANLAAITASLNGIVAALTQPVQTSFLGQASEERLRGAIDILRGDCAHAVRIARSVLLERKDTP